MERRQHYNIYRRTDAIANVFCMYEHKNTDTRVGQSLRQRMATTSVLTAIDINVHAPSAFGVWKIPDFAYSAAFSIEIPSQTNTTHLFSSQIFVGLIMRMFL